MESPEIQPHISMVIDFDRSSKTINREKYSFQQMELEELNIYMQKTNLYT